MGKKSKSTTTRTIYGKTTTTNPYVTSKTNNNGTVSSFKKGTALDAINKYVNKNALQMLDNYLNPSLDTVTNKAKMSSFMDALSSNSLQSLENDIINPLSRRNMIRSSQAANLYNNLARNNSSQIANYANELLANSQKDTASLISNLLMWYLNGYGVLNDTQKQSLATSQGNSSKTNTATDNGMDYSQLIQAARLASSL